MPITLNKLCQNTDKSYKLKIVAGASGLRNIVRWVYMIEDPEVLDFLHGNELVFTTGIGRVKSEALLDFAKNLIKKGASGLVVNLGPYIKAVPQELIKYCTENDFPLFTIPWEIRIVEITYDFCSRIVESEKSETTIAEAFKNIIKSTEAIKEYKHFLISQGFLEKNNYRIAVISFLKENEDITEKIEKINRIKLWHIFSKFSHPTALFIYESKVVIIRQSSEELSETEVVNCLKKALNGNKISYVIGVSEQGTGFKSIEFCFKQAKSAYKTAVLNNTDIEIYSNIGINKVIFGVEDKKILNCFIGDVLNKISQYDEENGTDYEEVLFKYLMNNTSVKKLSEDLNIHRNTVNYKIKQIKEIFNLELNESQKAELILAFRIKSILNRRLL